MYAKRVTGEWSAVSRAGIAALMLAAGIGFAAAPALAQAPAKPAAPAAKPAAGAPAAEAEKDRNYWVKLCDVAHTAADPKKDGAADAKKDIKVCVTHHEQIHTQTGMVLVSVAIRQIEGQKDVVMIMVPLGMQLRPGVLMKFDEGEPVTLPYTFCAALGCYAEIDTTPEIITKMKTAKQITVGFMSPDGKLVPMPVPLNGFEKTFTGEPADSKQYMEERKRMMLAIREKQMEAFKKAKEEAEAKKGAGGAAAPKAPVAADKKPK